MVERVSRPLGYFTLSCFKLWNSETSGKAAWNPFYSIQKKDCFSEQSFFVWKIPYKLGDHCRTSVGLLWAFGGKNWRAVLSHTTRLPLWYSRMAVCQKSLFPFHLSVFRRDTEPLPKERLNMSIDTSKKNNNIKTHSANLTCRVRNMIIHHPILSWLRLEQN